MLLQCPGINCEGSDWPITNYSAEGVELLPPFFSVVYPPLNPPPIDEQWSMPGCLYVCTSYISQEDADLCALRQAILCITGPPGQEIWYSAPATCSSPCPDGTVFYYTVPAGMFVARTYADALAQAQEYACAQAVAKRFCIGELPRCACVGNLYTATVGIDVAHSPLTWTVSGLLPPGLQLISHGDSATITGTPFLAGTYVFQIIATDAQGNYALKMFTIQVVQITTNVLDPFVIGTPYSFQLAATGGSGNYSWRVATGTLPDGLVLSISGLISGTPTVSATGGTLTFEVIDLTCEATTKQFFTPHVALTTHGTTTVRTKRGWPAYDGSSALYKTLSWTGYQVQLAQTAGDINAAPEFCGGARYVYSGFSQIDINGNFTAQHNKDLYVACNNRPFPSINSNILLSGSPLLGYCWHLDPGSCSDCSSDEDTWIYAGNVGSHSQYDFPNSMITSGAFASNTATTWSYLSNGFIAGGLALLDGVQNFPLTSYNSINGPWSSIASDGAWSSALSDEYTDADALASQVVYTNNSAVSENLPNYRQWSYNFITNRSSRTTHVDYTLNLTNLVVGESYIARVEWRYSNGTTATHSYPFTAAATIHQIIDAVATPAANATITVKSPSVIYAP